MWNGKKKAVTFSFDDGVLQDIDTIAILNKYGLKGTFNLNSGLFSTKNTIFWTERYVCRDKINAEDVRKIYEGHEVAVHTLNHPSLAKVEDDAEVIRQVEEDRKALSELCGYEVVGMAYPNGSTDERVIRLIRENTGVKYARNVKDNFKFDLQTELLDFCPSVHYIDEKLEQVVEEFLALETDEPQLLYIWGHTYALDSAFIDRARFEAVCKKLAGKSDIFYGTNKEVLLEK